MVINSFTSERDNLFPADTTFPSISSSSDCQLNHGDSGGPLVDSNKSVIGVNTFTYGNSSDQKYYAVQINAIKSGLDTFGISYINAGAQATTQTPDEEEPEEKEGPDADLVTALKSEITKAKAVDTKNYTEESVKVLNDHSCCDSADQQEVHSAFFFQIFNSSFYI